MKTPTIKDIRAAAAARRARRERQRRLLIAAAALLLVGVGGGVFVLPSWIQAQIERRGMEALDRRVTVERVRVNPLTLTVVVEGLRVIGRDEAAFAGWRSLTVNANAWGLLTGGWSFDAIELDGFEGWVSRDEAGRLNFADLLPAEGSGAATGAPAGGRPLDIGRLVVTDARLDFADASRSEPFTTTLGPVSFTLEQFHTRGDPRAPYAFAATTEAGESLTWRGTLSAVPLRSAGRVEIEGLRLAKYAPYYADRLAATVAAGTLAVWTDYEADLAGAEPVVRLRGGEARLTGLVLTAPEDGAEALRADDLKLTGLAFDLQRRRVEVERFAGQGGAVRVTRTQAGIDWQTWLLEVDAGLETQAAVGPAWSGVVGSAEWTDLGFSLRDQTTPTEVVADGVVRRARVEGLDWGDLSRPAAVALEATWGAGVVRVSGEVAPQPFRPALEVAISDLELPPLGGYLPLTKDLRLGAGRLDLAGTVAAAGDGLVFRGAANVAGMQLQDAAGGALAGWEDLRINGIDAATAPAALAIASISLIRPEGRWQVATAAVADEGEGGMRAAQMETPAPRAEDPAPLIRVERVDVVDGRFEYVDATLPKMARVTLDELSGSLEGLSSTELGKARVDLRGRVNGRAPVAVAGAFNPLGRPASADVRIDFDQVDLVPVGGYVAKYAGYALEGGRLTLDVDFELADRAIRSETVATLDGFALGGRVPGPDATSLPVPLAVALLQDRQGRIVIDLPVAGRLDDPEFRVGRVVWRVITNLLTKAATAPFGLLGALVGGAPEELDRQVFAAGTEELEARAIQKLDTVARALAERPGLRLEIGGEWDAESDGVALRPRLLESSLRALAPAGAVDAAGVWVPTRRAEALVQRYLAVFGEPPLAAPGTAATPMAAVPVAPPAAVGRTAVAPPSLPPERDDTLLGWLKRKWAGEQEGAEGTTAPAITAPEPAEEPDRDAGGLVPVLVALAPAEIEARLLAAVRVDDDALTALADRRAAAVAGYLAGAGVPADRLVLLPAAPGAARVTLGLR